MLIILKRGDKAGEERRFSIRVNAFVTKSSTSPGIVDKVESSDPSKGGFGVAVGLIIFMHAVSPPFPRGLGWRFPRQKRTRGRSPDARPCISVA